MSSMSLYNLRILCTVYHLLFVSNKHFKCFIHAHLDLYINEYFLYKNKPCEYESEYDNILVNLQK